MNENTKSGTYPFSGMYLAIKRNEVLIHGTLKVHEWMNFEDSTLSEKHRRLQVI